MGKDASGKTVAKNAAALYLVQFVSFLIPIAEVSVLARSLGIEIYGQILFCQALALTGSLLVEYGFNINAAQQVAVHRKHPGELRELFTQIMLAKIMLAFPFVLLLLVAWTLGLLDNYVPSGQLLLFVLAYFVAFGFSPMWYFQGIERMAFPAMLDVALRLSGLTVLIIIVHTPDDFYMALPLLAIPPVLNTGLTLYWAGHLVGRLPAVSIRDAWRQIRQGFHFFVYRSASNLALSAVPVLLGVSAGQRAVGEFAPPEKLIKGMTSLALPFLTAIFPFFAREFHPDGERQGAASYKQPMLVIALIGAIALIGSAVGLWLGPWVLDALLGTHVPESLSVYYVLIGLVPLRIINQSIALVLLIPAGRAQSCSYAISFFSIAGLLAGAWLATRQGGYGMAWGLLICEILLWLVLMMIATGLIMSSSANVKGASTDQIDRL
ncbi:MAG: oligosaccharide flippase family protein [Burkholderiaceae bacterium]